MTLQELKPLIIDWAKAKDLIHAENADKQRLKLIEECGELASAILKNDIAKQKDAIGDIFVVLVILYEQLELEYLFDLDLSENQNSISAMIYNIIEYAQIHKFEISPLTYLNDICIRLNHDLTECANLAWNEIKDRKGQTIRGTFIKESEYTENHFLGHA